MRVEVVTMLERLARHGDWCVVRGAL